MARLDEGLKWYERILAPRLNTIDGQIAKRSQIQLLVHQRDQGYDLDR